MKKFPLVAFLFLSLSCFAQVEEYLSKNTFSIEKIEQAFDKKFYENQVFFFGFIHGSATPQMVEPTLLQLLHEHGVRYYAPEVDQSLAYFLNQYLASGDEKLLTFIVHFYNGRVPQDASVQFKNKWRQLYKFNKTATDKLTILGFDAPIDQELTLTYLAHLAPSNETGNPLIDSLKYFTHWDIEELNIRSGKPIMKSGKPWSYFFGGKKGEYYKRLLAAYKEDSVAVLASFGEYADQVERIFSPIKAKGREKLMFENFKMLATPLLDKGEKIYCNFGYYHIQQEAINGRLPFAAMVQKSLPYKVVTLQGLLFDSECLDHVKLCFDKKINLKGVMLDKMNYCGYKTSKTLDGDSFFERVNGHQLIRKSTNDIEIVNLVGDESPFQKEMRFADFERGGKSWKVKEGAVTTDYFQYLIVMKNSKSNVPYVED